MASPRRYIRWLLMLVTVCSIVVGGASLTSAQCVVRTDWPVYVIQRGDTLARIAQRYGTNSATLAAANCLTNFNLIFAGQQLRVPTTAGTVITPVPGPVYPSALAASFQMFEHGFMTWKAGTGEIDVYLGSGGVIANGGTVSVFPASNYGRLPDNASPTVPPSGLIVPSFGFGKVWGNYPAVRQALGFATAGEIGYLMQVFPPNAITYQFTIPDGRTVYVNNNLVWSFSSSIPVVIPPTPAGPVVTTTSASYQPFQGGFMIWEAHTANVVVFYNNSTYQVYLARTYSPLRDNPVTDLTPAGLVRPAFGFGKVWGNYPLVRQQLGWATQGESYYAPTFRSSSPSGYPQTCFPLPDGRIVTYAVVNRANVWNMGGVCS